MAKIKKYKIARRLGSGVYEKTQSQKFMLSEQNKRRSRSGRPKRPTDYGLSLIQKQRVRFAYGVSEKQFVNYVNKAFESAKRGEVPVQTLFKLIEQRLDNVVYRSGIASTRAFARQLVSHGHITVNGKKMTIPSYSVKKDDCIEIREGSRSKKVFEDVEASMKEKKSNWLDINPTKTSVTVTGDPKDPEPFFNFQAVIEFYSR